jgi:D-arabinose 5-phosphate isomerase GutQ
MKEESYGNALESLSIESAAITNIAGYLDKKAFGDAVDALSACDNVITCASGSSGIAAKKFAHTLCCIERSGYFLSPAEAVHGGLGCVKKNDAVVMVSRGGKTAELLPIISVVKTKGAKLIAVTENLDSPLAKAADILIPMKIERESDPCNVMATASFIATVALFDAMIAAIMEETGYRLEQFALIHPGGAVGERLNK